jgi:hypothetical protein
VIPHEPSPNAVDRVLYAVGVALACAVPVCLGVVGVAAWLKAGGKVVLW